MEEKTLLKAVIVFPIRARKVLLATKTKEGNKIGAGCRNGYGGGIEPGETAIDAAVRELEEESGLIARPEHLEKVAEIAFHNQKENGMFSTCRCEVFVIRMWRGSEHATATMLDPRWFSVKKLPLGEMLPADPMWVPLVVNGWRITGEVWYGPRQKTLLMKPRIAYVAGFKT